MTTTTLIDRYVDAALRSVPPSKRSDIQAELLASIADAVDDRVNAGEDRAAAETAVLTDLGDPARLAAGLADTPLHLIGPGLFLDYVRLLRALAVTVLPLTAIGVAVVQIVQRNSVGDAIGAVVGTTLTTAVHLGFWTTLLFAFFERLPGIKGPLGGPWQPSMLPAPRALKTPGPGELIVLAVGNAVFVTAILLSRGLSPERDATGHAIPILHPDVYRSGLISIYIGLLIAAAGVALAARYYRRLIPGVHGLGVAAAAMVIWAAAQDRVVNPAFAQAAGWTPGAVMWIHNGLVIGSAITVLTELARGVRGLSRR